MGNWEAQPIPPRFFSSSFTHKINTTSLHSFVHSHFTLPSGWLLTWCYTSCAFASYCPLSTLFFSSSFVDFEVIVHPLCSSVLRDSDPPTPESLFRLHFPFIALYIQHPLLQLPISHPPRDSSNGDKKRTRSRVQGRSSSTRTKVRSFPHGYSSDILVDLLDMLGEHDGIDDLIDQGHISRPSKTEKHPSCRYTTQPFSQRDHQTSTLR